mmetsp:Transcript_22054/g.74960  ORF Transcript_22054/g.74960 Transcript_22054/m.74960 type:complete len:214 (-) Transcript_22054:146-787(-)
MGIDYKQYKALTTTEGFLKDRVTLGALPEVIVSVGKQLDIGPTKVTTTTEMKVMEYSDTLTKPKLCKDYTPNFAVKVQERIFDGEFQVDSKSKSVMYRNKPRYKGIEFKFEGLYSLQVPDKFALNISIEPMPGVTANVDTNSLNFAGESEVSVPGLSSMFRTSKMEAVGALTFPKFVTFQPNEQNDVLSLRSKNGKHTRLQAKFEKVKFTGIM